MATKEFVRLTDRCAYFPGGVNIGLIECDGSSILVDAGNDKEAGRLIAKALEGKGLTLDHILVTHSNADHIGGAAALQARTGCAVHATRLEGAFCADPELEAAFLWGAYAPDELRGKFFKAPACLTEILPDSGPAAKDGTLSSIQVIPLPGHFFAQVGFQAADGTLFAGDAVFGADSIAKHPVFFLYDVAAFLASLDRVAAAPLVLPGHGEPTIDGAGLAAINKAAVEKVAEAILSTCAESTSFETLLARLADAFSITLDWGQYALVGSTLRSYLSYLRKLGQVEASFEANRLLWRRLP